MLELVFWFATEFHLVECYQEKVCREYTLIDNEQI